MKTFRSRKRSPISDESGLSLIEVMVAMMIFAMIAVGLAAGMVASMRMTDNARDRTAAANLAAEAIDRAQATTDILKLETDNWTRTVGGTVFTIKSDVLWVGSLSGAVGKCSAGTGSLQYKRVNVAVSWPGMTRAVHADTQVAPNTRINDPDKGVIVVSVSKAGGAPNPGILVSAAVDSPADGAVAIAATPVTDAQGCAYLFNVTPGNYVVSISKTGSMPLYRDIFQVGTPTLKAVVEKGKSTTPAFEYDQSVVFKPKFAANFAPVPAESVFVPPTLDLSAANTYGVWVRPGNADATLHPFIAGYDFIAGKLANDRSVASACLAVDPAAWPAYTDGTGSYAGKRMQSAGKPGASEDALIPSGVVKFVGLGGSYIKATRPDVLPAGSEDPGCTLPSSYVFRLPTGPSSNVALPYGTWQLTSGSTASTQNTVVLTTALQPRTRGSVVGGVSTVLTLDPRELVAP